MLHQVYVACSLCVYVANMQITVHVAFDGPQCGLWAGFTFACLLEESSVGVGN